MRPGVTPNRGRGTAASTAGSRRPAGHRTTASHRQKLDGAAQPDAIGEGGGDGVRLLHDDRVSSRPLVGERDVVALTGDDLQPQPEQPAEGSVSRSGGEDELVGLEVPAARTDGTHAVTGHGEPGDPPMLDELNVSTTRSAAMRLSTNRPGSMVRLPGRTKPPERGP